MTGRFSDEPPDEQTPIEEPEGVQTWAEADAQDQRYDALAERHTWPENTDTWLMRLEPTADDLYRMGAGR